MTLKAPNTKSHDYEFSQNLLEGEGREKGFWTAYIFSPLKI
jgi:hypothetical protein